MIVLIANDSKSNKPSGLLRAKGEVLVTRVTKTASSKIANPIWFCLFAIIVCVNHFFSLVPWAKIRGTFNSSDIGLLIVVLLLLFLVGSRKVKVRLNNGISYLLLLYLCMVMGGVANVSFNYGQSIFDGLVAIRHQLYYLSFFVFLMIFDDERCIKQFLNFVMFVGAILCMLGLINYFGTTIYHHMWAEGHGVRSGVTRGFFAGMGLITFSLFWVVAQWLVTRKFSASREFIGLLLIIAHIMRQTRSTLVAVFIAVLSLLIHQRKVKTVISGAVLIVLLVGVVDVVSEKNFILDPFTNAYEEMSEGKGTWAARMQQLETDIAIFLKNPVVGGGTYAIRLNLEGKTSMQLRKLTELHENADLGYTHWLKAYGIVGAIWLIGLYITMGGYIKHIMLGSIDEGLRPMALMSSGYMLFVMISFITDPHFIWPDRILLICLALATMVRVRQLAAKK